MTLSELTAYAAERYHIEEQHKWADFPGFSVLADPNTGKWAALLMRQWDTETGTEIERCDLKCGSDTLQQLRRPYLSAPIRMRGNRWVGVSFGDDTEREVVLRLFDRAVGAGGHGYTIVLPSPVLSGKGEYRETAIPVSSAPPSPAREELPQRLRELRRLYTHTGSRAESFYRQAEFMRYYEDDVPWNSRFICYFPTYQDMTTRQLRGYFTWRAAVRRGEFQPISTSAAYVYVYELLNGIGGASPEECLEKLRALEAGYLDSGIGEPGMRTNLRRWELEYAVLHDLPPERVRPIMDPEMLAQDAALSALRFPGTHSDEEVFAALCRFGARKTASSPVITGDPEDGRHLFCQAWRAASSYVWQGQDLFTLCFGKPVRRRWYPLANAVVYALPAPVEREYVLNDCRRYCCSGGVWYSFSYEKLSFDLARLRGFVHETDARLRRYRKNGRYLRESPSDEWAIPYIDAVIDEDRKARLEAARPKVTIDLSGIEQIRADALVTRESLLTDEERGDYEPEEPAAVPEEEAAGALDRLQFRVLQALLAGQDPTELLRADHTMPSIAADAINEALWEEFGDTVVLCEDERLLLVDDYREELEEYLGGGDNGGA